MKELYTKEELQGALAKFSTKKEILIFFGKGIYSKNYSRLNKYLKKHNLVFQKTAYLKEDLSIVVKKCHTFSDVLRHYNKTTKSGNFQILNFYIKEYNIDISHFNRHFYSKNTKKRISDSEYFLNGVKRNNSRLKDRLKKHLPYTCSICNIDPIWNNKELILQIDHIDGDNCNNIKENLRFICPNCHSQTDTFCRGKK